MQDIPPPAIWIANLTPLRSDGTACRSPQTTLKVMRVASAALTGLVGLAWSRGTAQAVLIGEADLTAEQLAVELAYHRPLEIELLGRETWAERGMPLAVAVACEAAGIPPVGALTTHGERGWLPAGEVA